jgi:hypothetical protein
MSPGDWIALAAFGLTGFGMFCALLGAIWRWSTAIEKRLAAIETRLGIFLGDGHNFRARGIRGL